MNAILATGGLNDVAMAIGEAIDIGFFLVISALLAFAWWKRSLAATVGASLLILLEGAMLEPWTVMAPPASSNPYEAFWLFRLRVICAFWVILFALTAACWIRVLRYRKFKRDGQIAT